MNIEFILQDDLPTVLSQIVSDETDEKFKVQLNTVLVIVSEKGLTLNQFFESVRPYIDEKDPGWRRKAMKVFAEVMSRKRDFKVTDAEGLQILKVLEAKVLEVAMASESISAVAELVSFVTTPEMCSSLINLF
jgi:hypothetical protein